MLCDALCTLTGGDTSCDDANHRSAYRDPLPASAAGVRYISAPRTQSRELSVGTARRGVSRAARCPDPSSPDQETSSDAEPVQQAYHNADQQ